MGDGRGERGCMEEMGDGCGALARHTARGWEAGQRQGITPKAWWVGNSSWPMQRREGLSRRARGAIQRQHTGCHIPCAGRMRPTRLRAWWGLIAPVGPAWECEAWPTSPSLSSSIPCVG